VPSFPLAFGKKKTNDFNFPFFVIFKIEIVITGTFNALASTTEKYSLLAKLTNNSPSFNSLDF
jgi:hypothetical protein